MEKLNIAELLKDCPKGMELDCTMFENLEFDHIDKNNGAYPIICRVKTSFGYNNIHTFTEYGCYQTENYSKCVIFPKGKTTWEGFQRPFEDGDIIITGRGRVNECAAIFKESINYEGYDRFNYYALASLHTEIQVFKTENWAVNIVRFATEEEKQILFDAIKVNGYKWNAETKTLEKLIVPKFKVGDRVRGKISKAELVIRMIDEYFYYDNNLQRYAISYQDNYELAPNKFDITTLKPFDMVLVRHNKDNKWCGSLFSHIDEDLHSHCYKFVTTSGKSYPYCIPYGDNQHLLGTTDDCDEHYKTWE